MAPPKPVESNRWSRPEGDFAIRIDTNTAEWRGKGLIIEHGTRAMIFQGGVYTGEVPEGTYDTPGFWRSHRFTPDQDMVAVVVDAGDVTIDLENGGLRSSDGFELGMRSRVVLRIKDPDALFVNLMKGRKTVKISDPDGKDDLESQLADEAQMVLKSMVAGRAADELFAQLGVRAEFESRLREALAVSLARLGLELVQLRFLDFEGSATPSCARSGPTSQSARRRSRSRSIRRGRTSASPRPGGATS